MIRVSITDDHDLFRSGMALLIDKVEGFEVVAQTASAEELLELLPSTHVHVALVDISMGGMSGLDVLPLIKQNFPDVRTIVLTMHEEGQYILKAIRNGASGYLLKHCDAKELISAIETVNAGKKYINQDLSLLMMDSVTEEADEQKLSNRELEVLQWVAKGKTAKEIAETLFVSKRTIETHRSNILKKLDAQNTAELIRKASEKGYL